MVSGYGDGSKTAAASSKPLCERKIWRRLCRALLKRYNGFVPASREIERSHAPPRFVLEDDVRRRGAPGVFGRRSDGSGRPGGRIRPRTPRCTIGLAFLGPGQEECRTLPLGRALRDVAAARVVRRRDYKSHAREGGAAFAGTFGLRVQSGYLPLAKQILKLGLRRTPVDVIDVKDERRAELRYPS